MASLNQEFGIRRVYEAAAERQRVALRLSDREVELGKREFDLYAKVAGAGSERPRRKGIAADLGMDQAQLRRLLKALESAGSSIGPTPLPATLSGVEFHKLFNKVLPSWLDEAFSHPFWERMMSGKGSRRLYSGWLIELYHYTRNANRHMPLSCAHTREKAIKDMRAKHYAEEWNHYHYFLKSLKALGFTEDERRQVGAAADDAGAVELHAPGRARGHPRLLDLLGGARGDDHRPRRLQPVLREVRRALRLAARVRSRRSSRTSISTCSTSTRTCSSTSSARSRSIPAARAGRVLEYGHQLVEHIWLWTDSIEKYYGDESNPMPRPAFIKLLD